MINIIMVMHLPTHEEVLSRLSYDKTTGEFTWLAVEPSSSRAKAHNKRQAGKTAGYRCPTRNSILVSFNYNNIRAGRLAWFYVTGEWPQGIILHRNDDGFDCRWENLFEGTPSQKNHRIGGRPNRSSRYRGVTRTGDKWAAQITQRGRHTFMGGFASQEDAARAYDAKARELFGEHAFQNFPEVG